jgi:hypothetical protein
MYEVKRPLRRHRHGWEDSNVTDFRDIWWKSVDWIHMAQDRDVAGYYEHSNDALGFT